MLAKLLSGALVAGLLVAVAAPITAEAAGLPKTKAACEKVKTMHWDDASGKCVKS